MAAQRTMFVNKQFNSPINLYSPQAIQETLDRQTQVLANGAVGIDFNQLAKPANLQNSAVLRMLEEEEARQRAGGQPNLKRVAWPPPPEDQDFDFVEQGPVQAKTRGIGDIASYQSSPSSGSSPQPASRSAVPSSPSPVSPGGTLRQPSHFQHQPAPKGWRPVTPPATSPISHQPTQPIWYNQQQQQNHHPQQHPQDYNSLRPSQNQAPAAFEAPPSTITLRPEPPISQAPAPVYQAQPAATKAPISGNMRGDLKWPPPSVKAQTEAENRARMELAKGPAFRPRRVHKDYSGFFAQHALNSSYPGYRAPPGTQYFTPAYQH
ncbi:PREDICTED: translation initiation factor IF-2-like isoform X1 [Eufriesea mexicana]|uniref:translation initiation factor IF-2-like isoform X1 n=1 Tax=Eufriesea mexicana TaxID=516756 RepID=UPI00083C7622|nr:PREDICTED: translation initiation factor IF-2-like isoform X1 [Eufriesea mexicana]XP_017765572.1 PREDICTED: translation initiation factor IF-2-like isoform X1 [Eufriesea mexicana]XP_017765573.1 PREDICTED: translation initiation factor IF-2-like isoform X1 [Eufriesea mexicana]XP_017765574.1 PREDICTED: translation initiation factor IF-2-like isoform X1 [Eufriesea mexicana]XP_017765575.1 PREDICTED: translation initiation factor IF-2-like isoform X1 [Eufriesea mexicana]